MIGTHYDQVQAWSSQDWDLWFTLTFEGHKPPNKAAAGACLWVNKKGREVLGRACRNTRGPRWKKKPRAKAIGFVEKPLANAHLHGALRLPLDYQIAEFTAALHEAVGTLLPGGSLDVQPYLPERASGTRPRTGINGPVMPTRTRSKKRSSCFDGHIRRYSLCASSRGRGARGASSRWAGRGRWGSAKPPHWIPREPEQQQERCWVRDLGQHLRCPRPPRHQSGSTLRAHAGHPVISRQAVGELRGDGGDRLSIGGTWHRWTPGSERCADGEHR